MSQTLHAVATRKAVLRLVPLLMLAYFMSFIDRTNIGLAKTSLQTDIGIDAAAYGLGAGLFFISYALFEVPSNLILHRVGARKWIARIAVTWGLISAAMVFVNNATTFYFLRFLLGAAEAGLYPGLMYIVTIWFAQRHRATIVGLLLIASSFAFMVGNPLGGALMLLDGMGGLHGWQWLFLLEGLPTVLLGIFIFFKLPDSPDKASWLTPQESAAMIAEASGEGAQSSSSHIDFKAGLTNPLILTLSAIWFLIQVATYGVAFFTPAVVEDLGISGSFTIGLVAGVVGIGAIAGVVVFPRLQRRLHRDILLVTIAFIAAGALSASFAAFSGASSKMAILTFTMFFVVGVQPVIWSLVMERVSGRAAAGLLAYVNTIGLLGGFVGPYAFGLAETATGTATSGILILVATNVLCLLLVPVLARNKRRATEADSAAQAIDSAVSTGDFSAPTPATPAATAQADDSGVGSR